MEQDVIKNDLENLVKGNNEFALDLYQALREEQENIFFSPYSVSSALAMIYAGSREETEKQMAATLHFNLTQEKLHTLFNMISTILSSRGKDIYSQDQQGFRLINLNSIWSQKDIIFSLIFLDILSHNYEASVESVDFINNPEEVRLSVNRWVKEQTNNLIPELLTEGSVDSKTIFIVTSVVYFKAAWCYQFNEAVTISRQFHLLNGDTVEAPMMRLSEYLSYTEKEGYRAIELPYLGEKLSMVIMVPEIHQFEAREKELDYQKISAVINDLKGFNVNLTMPKFKFKAVSRLGSVLSQMGMLLAFSNKANFSGITENSNFFISDVFHDTFISVDENGTEATAATGVLAPRAAYGETIDLNIDRPFIFLIRDNETKVILFLGRLLNPLEGNG